MNDPFCFYRWLGVRVGGGGGVKLTLCGRLDKICTLGGGGGGGASTLCNRGCLDKIYTL